MGVITSDRFNPIKAYCNVRLQQGVPLVDADVNELDDIRKFEVRAFLKWFVGNGIPDGNDGFRIAAATTPAPDDFQILAGSQLPSGSVPTPPSAATNEFALHRFGRCIVDGLDVIIQANATYTTQVLSTVDVNSPYSLPLVGAIPVPASPPGPVLVYLDIWERVVSPTEDSNLIVPPLGTESCARIKRQWVVRTRLGTNVPVPGDLDFISNHLYYGLASINRRVGGGIAAPILATDITDLRERGLSITPSTLIPDVLGGTTSAYRQGQNRPAMSLRDAINAIARGEVPALKEHPVNAVATGVDEYPGRSTLDGTNGLIISWTTFNSAGIGQVYVGRLDLGNPSAGFAATPITSAPTGRSYPAAATLPGGDLIVSYQSGESIGDIYFKRGATPALLSASGETQVTTTVKAFNPRVVASGNIAVFLFRLNNAIGWHYRRYNTATSAWIDASPHPVAGASGYELEAAVDTAGNVWIAHIIDGGTGTLRLNPTTGTLDTTGTFHSAANFEYFAPCVLCADSQVWAFWTGSAGVWFANYNGTTWGPQTRLPYTLGNDAYPVAALDSSKQIALTYSRLLPPDEQVYNLFLSHGDPDSGGWFPPSAATSSVFSDFTLPGGLIAAAGSLWLYWARSANAGNRLYYRRICYPL